MTQHTIRKVFIVVSVLAICSPLFAWAAEAVGYSEPLENVAGMLGVEEHQLYSGLFSDYVFPGLDARVGVFASAVVGIVLTLLLAYGIGRGLKR